MDLVVLLVIAGIAALVCTAFGAWIAGQKNRDPIEGAILGGVFGPFGVLIEALLPTKALTAANRPEGSGTADRLEALELVAATFRAALDQADPKWDRLPYPRQRQILERVEKPLRQRLKLSPTAWGDVAAEARRMVLRTSQS